MRKAELKKQHFKIFVSITVTLFPQIFLLCSFPGSNFSTGGHFFHCCTQFFLTSTIHYFTQKPCLSIYYLFQNFSHIIHFIIFVLVGIVFSVIILSHLFLFSKFTSLLFIGLVLLFCGKLGMGEPDISILMDDAKDHMISTLLS